MLRVKLPNFDALEGSTPEEKLAAFYRALGWDGESCANPMKVHLHEDDHNQLFASAMDMVPVWDKARVGMIYVNIGPSGGGTCKGWVDVEKDWIELPSSA